MSGKFVGQQVRDMTLAAVCSAASGEHLVVIGPPGCGKTSVVRRIAKKIFGDASQFFRFDPSTQPEVLKGYPNMKKYFADKVYEVDVTGSAYDPTKRQYTFDEWWRAMDALFDVGIDVLDRQDVDPITAPVVWATANFVAQNERADAVRDRFGLTLRLKRETLDVKAVAQAQLAAIGSDMEVDNGLPSLSDVEAVRSAVPGAQATAAVSDVVGVLCEEAEKYSENDGFNFEPNPRRIKQWVNILFRMTVLRTGDPDFTAVHPDALMCLRWAWPSKDDKEAAAWGEVCDSLADPMQNAIDNLFTTAHEKMRLVTGDIVTKARALGTILDEGKQNLIHLAQSRGLVDPATGEPTDPRIREAEQRMAEAMAEILRA